MPLLQTKADASAWGYGFLGATASTGNFYLIQQLSSSAVSAVTFSSIPSTYKSLQLRFNLVVSYGGGAYLPLTLNGDNGANYVFHSVGTNGSTSGAYGSTSQNWIGLFQGAGNTVNTYPAVGIVDLIDYSNTGKYKVAKAFIGTNGNTTYQEIALFSGAWLSTAAVTSLTLSSNPGTYTGTVSLYGVS